MDGHPLAKQPYCVAVFLEQRATLPGAVSGSCPISLTFLGAGSAFSRRYQTTCALLEIAPRRRWLIDCGRQAPEQLCAVGLDWYDIELQLITHAHGDHIFGLEEFAFARYYLGGSGKASVLGGGNRPALLAHRAVRKEVWESLAPSLRYIDRGKPSADGRLDDYFELIEAARSSSSPNSDGRIAWEHFSRDGVDVLAHIVPHVPFKPSCGFEFSWQREGQRYGFWWSGDSLVEGERLNELAQRYSLLFQDCSFAPQGGGVHGDFEQLLALPEAVRRKIVLMHHDDDLDHHREKAERAGFRLAEPGQRFDLERGLRVAPCLAATGS